MEILFSRQIQYSIDLDETGEAELAKHLKISVKKMNSIAEEGDLMSEHGDEIINWVEQHPEYQSIADEGQPDDVEIYV